MDLTRLRSLVRLPLAAFCSLVPLSMTRPVAAADARIEFNRDVRPIVSNTCFKCHGVDDKARKGKLRLDERESALKAGSSGEVAIVPGKPDQSEIVRRVMSSDPDEVMPPPAAKMSLTDAQKQVLKQWVAQGAEYQQHWAFVAPKAAPPPAVKDASWVRNPIDAFVLARLEREGLKPSPEADRYSLARRVSLDLVGLPPTPEEADAYVNDAAPDAYEKFVDRLLASPHYGERWARRWLDLARYADTNGYEKDRPRSVWPYRDWVINAMNADMPFDQFTVEQLAGDMLPNATQQQKVATGFHRNTMLNEEGGIDPQEYRFYSLVDRVGTTGTTWLGLTVACAQCHTHKYDPIRHTEYYQLMALLNNADEPELEVLTPDVIAARKAAEVKIAALTAALPSKFPVQTNAKWETPLSAIVTTAGGSKPEPADGGSWRFTGPSPERDAYTIAFDSDAATVDRLRLEVLKDGAAGPGRTPHGNFVLSEISVTVAPKDAPDKAQPVKLARAEADFSQTDYAVASAIDGKPTTGWAIYNPAQPIAERTATFYLETPTQFPHGAHWTVRLDQSYGEKHTIARLRLSLGSAEGAPGISIEHRRTEALASATAEWEKSQAAKAVQWTVLRPAEMVSSLPILVQQADGSILASGDASKRDTYDLTFRNDAALKGITAIRLEALPDESLPRHGPGKIFYEGPFGDFFLSEITLDADGRPMKFARAMQSFAAGAASASAAIDGNPQTGWSIDGGQGKAHAAVFTLAEPTGDAKVLKLRLLFEKYFACPLGRFRISVTSDPRAARPDWQPALLPAEIESLLTTPDTARGPAQRDAIRTYFLSIAPQLAAAHQEIDAVRASEPHPPTALVMTERPAAHPRSTHLHHRGEFLQPEEAVSPAVPSFLPPLPAAASPDRLTFARWLVSGQNPLTARVTVNRQWAALFGRGIARTTEDFGSQGDPPSNPELLDWLAINFVKDSWSMKRLHKLIVTSATYRQSAAVTPEMAARDPQNVLLARGSRFRIDAELVRDAALRVSGLLSEKIGGPSVFPAQPASVTNEAAYGVLAWVTSTGEDRYRRSLYTYMKRSAPFALYGTFDAPSGEACLARREVSNTPLQALAVLNDTVFIEAAQSLGGSIATSPRGQDSDEARAAALFRRCLTRPPTKDELAGLVDFVGRQRNRLKSGELNAAKVAGPGPGDPVERATWTALARVVLNLDEALTR